jgi:hypothetical protein
MGFGKVDSSERESEMTYLISAHATYKAAEAALDAYRVGPGRVAAYFIRRVRSRVAPFVLTICVPVSE